MAATAASVAGPMLILAAVLIILRGFAFGDKTGAADVVRYWLPMHCFLGRSLQHGHIPAWNPYALSGTPFAADPQSGWMAVLPTALFTVLPCGTAIRWLVVLQPGLGGLGLYFFLRAEGLSRPAATVGGLALAVALSASRLPGSIRFPAALAWTAVALAACARYVRAGSWASRLAWLAALALAWGQIASGHLTVGLYTGTLGIAAYVAVKAVTNVRAKVWSGREAAMVAALPFLVFVPVNLAYLLPRLAYSSHTNLAHGYGTLSRLSRELARRRSPAFPGEATSPTWPLNLGLHPGLYLGAAVLGLAFAGWWSRRFRPLVIAFSVYGLASYVVALRWFVDLLPPSITRIRLVDQYLHEPAWFAFGLLVALAVLAGVGVQAWRDARSGRERAAMVVPGLVLWVALPLAAGVSPSRFTFFAVGGVAAGAALLVGLRRPAVFGLVAVVLAAETVTSSIVNRPAPVFAHGPLLLLPLSEPFRRPGFYLTPTSITETLRRAHSGRYLTIGARSGRRWQDPRSLQNNESMLFDIENVGGYQAIVLNRYWLFVRTLQRSPMEYNYEIFAQPSSVAMDLLDVRWIVANGQSTLPPGLTAVVRNEWTLYRRDEAPPRASVLGRWSVTGSPDAALRAVAAPGFDPAAEVVLERDPGIRPGAASSPGRARYASLGDQAARVTVDAPAPSVVLIRNVWDRDWHATIDGHRAEVMQADYVDQGVAVPAGHHVIELSYDDPTIGLGMLGSGLSLLALLGLAGGLALRRRRGAAEGTEDPEAEGAPVQP